MALSERSPFCSDIQDAGMLPVSALSSCAWQAPSVKPRTGHGAWPLQTQHNNTTQHNTTQHNTTQAVVGTSRVSACLRQAASHQAQGSQAGEAVVGAPGVRQGAIQLVTLQRQR